MEKIIYYEDELNDEFSDAKIEPRVIDEKYIFIHKNPFWNVCSYLIQHVLSVPIKVLYAKFKFHIKYIGREKYKECKRTGFFIYGNHTQSFADTFIISNTVYPKINFLIVNPENVSMKGLGNFVQMFGAIPIPNKMNGMKKFMEAVKKRVNDGHSMTIFPEAHIWPYYTKIRPFKSVSFKYPVEMKKPAFCVTNTYKRYKKDKVQIVTYIDGPFYPDSTLSKKEAQQKLRDEIYDTMVKRSKESNYECIKYIRK